MTENTFFPVLPNCPTEIARRTVSGESRILFFGEAGIGKSTLAAAVARTLYEQNRISRCIGADPGSPVFGVPGAVALAEWGAAGWQLQDLEALCTLDAGRFRLPLIAALDKLASRVEDGPLLVDAPGVIRGVAGAELLTSLMESLAIDVVLTLCRPGTPPPLLTELQGSSARVFVVPAEPQARRPGKKARAKRRTDLWDAYLRDFLEQRLPLSHLDLVGTPPPADVPESWQGRQIALIDQRRTVAMGEVVALEKDSLRVYLPQNTHSPKTLLLRDAFRDRDGLVNTAASFAATAVRQYLPPPDVLPYPDAGYRGGPRPLARVGPAFAVLVNGVLNDPLLHLRLRQEKRSLLFDLGESGRLPTRIAHQVSDVFISHAHIDHIAGFLWFLRSRMGDFPPCRLYGPPGLANHIEGLINGVLWDRIGDNGPRFQIFERHEDLLLGSEIRAGGTGLLPLPPVAVADGIILDDPTFRVRAAFLDHGTPVLAYAFEAKPTFNVRTEKLKQRNLPPGPWLRRLKECLAQGAEHAPIELPGGRVESAGNLAETLIRVTPGEKLVYATDLADSAANRDTLVKLARGAHTLFCEAAFIEADADQARRTSHLTARACGEIASAADVEQLLPFHFSRRYDRRIEDVYREVAARCSRTVLPPPNQLAT